MITLVYTVDPKDAPAEKAWLNEMKVYPSYQDYFDWIGNKQYVRFCVIVPPDTALAVKLRHPLQLQKDYFQR
jgi:hypothetical protein